MIARKFARYSISVKVNLLKAYFSFLSQSFYTSSLRVSHNHHLIFYNNIFRMLLRLPPYCSTSLMIAEAHTDCYQAIIRKKVSFLKTRDYWRERESILKIIVSRTDGPIQHRLMCLPTMPSLPAIKAGSERSAQMTADKAMRSALHAGQATNKDTYQNTNTLIHTHYDI